MKKNENQSQNIAAAGKGRTFKIGHQTGTGNGEKETFAGSSVADRAKLNNGFGSVQPERGGNLINGNSQKQGDCLKITSKPGRFFWMLLFRCQI